MPAVLDPNLALSTSGSQLTSVSPKATCELTVGVPRLVAIQLLRRVRSYQHPPDVRSESEIDTRPLEKTEDLSPNGTESGLPVAFEGAEQPWQPYLCSIQPNELLVRMILNLSSRAEEIGLEPIRPDIIGCAVQLIHRLPQELAELPKVVPMSGGRFQLEWHDGPRTLEIEFESPHEVHYLKWDSSVGIEDEDIIGLSADTPSRIAALIEWFSGDRVDG